MRGGSRSHQRRTLEKELLLAAGRDSTKPAVVRLSREARFPAGSAGVSTRGSQDSGDIQKNEVVLDTLGPSDSGSKSNMFIPLSSLSSVRAPRDSGLVLDTFDPSDSAGTRAGTSARLEWEARRGAGTLDTSPDGPSFEVSRLRGNKEVVKFEDRHLTQADEIEQLRVAARSIMKAANSNARAEYAARIAPGESAVPPPSVATAPSFALDSRKGTRDVVAFEDRHFGDAEQRARNEYMGRVNMTAAGSAARAEHMARAEANASAGGNSLLTTAVAPKFASDERLGAREMIAFENRHFGDAELRDRNETRSRVNMHEAGESAKKDWVERASDSDSARLFTVGERPAFSTDARIGASQTVAFEDRHMGDAEAMARNQARSRINMQKAGNTAKSAWVERAASSPEGVALITVGERPVFASELRHPISPVIPWAERSIEQGQAIDRLWTHARANMSSAGESAGRDWAARAAAGLGDDGKMITEGSAPALETDKRFGAVTVVPFAERYIEQGQEIGNNDIQGRERLSSTASEANDLWVARQADGHGNITVSSSPSLGLGAKSRRRGLDSTTSPSSELQEFLCAAGVAVGVRGSLEVMGVASLGDLKALCRSATAAKELAMLGLAPKQASLLVARVRSAATQQPSRSARKSRSRSRDAEGRGEPQQIVPPSPKLSVVAQRRLDEARERSRSASLQNSISRGPEKTSPTSVSITSSASSPRPLTPKGKGKTLSAEIQRRLDEKRGGRSKTRVGSGSRSTGQDNSSPSRSPGPSSPRLSNHSADPKRGPINLSASAQRRLNEARSRAESRSGSETRSLGHGSAPTSPSPPASLGRKVSPVYDGDSDQCSPNEDCGRAETRSGSETRSLGRGGSPSPQKYLPSSSRGKAPSETFPKVVGPVWDSSLGRFLWPEREAEDAHRKIQAEAKSKWVEPTSEFQREQIKGRESISSAGSSAQAAWRARRESGEVMANSRTKSQTKGGSRSVGRSASKSPESNGAIRLAFGRPVPVPAPKSKK